MDAGGGLVLVEVGPVGVTGGLRLGRCAVTVRGGHEDAWFHVGHWARASGLWARRIREAVLAQGVAYEGRQ